MPLRGATFARADERRRGWCGAGARSVALYERAQGALPPDPLVRLPLADWRLLPALEAIGAAIGYDLVAR